MNEFLVNALLFIIVAPVAIMFLTITAILIKVIIDVFKE